MSNIGKNSKTDFSLAKVLANGASERRHSNNSYEAMLGQVFGKQIDCLATLAQRWTSRVTAELSNEMLGQKLLITKATVSDQ